MTTTVLRPLTLPALMLLSACALTACGGGGEAASADPPPCVSLPEITWTRSPVGSADWNDVLIDRQNRIWLAGYTEGIDTDLSGSRAVVRQLAPDGRVLWDSGSLFNTAGADAAEALGMDANGSLFVAGRTTGSLNGMPNAGRFDTFLAWNDAPGSDAGWHTHQTGTERPQYPRRIVPGAAGTVHLAGFDDIYIPSNFVEAWSDPFALRLQRVDTGTPGERLATLWQHQFNTPDDDMVEGLAVDQQAATFIAGHATSGLRRGTFVRKIAADGQVLWTARYTALPIDALMALRTTPQGHVLLAGNVFGSFHGGTPQGQQDVFVATLAGDDGRVLSSWQFGSAAADWLTDMAVDAQGRIILFGATAGDWLPGHPQAGSGDLFLMKLGADGSVLASAQWGTADTEDAHRVAVDHCGRVVAVGSSTAGGVRSGVVWFWNP